MSASCPADGTASLQYLRSVRTAFSHLSPEVCVINDAGWCGWCWPASVPLSASVCGAACPIFFTCLLTQAFIDTLQCIGLQDTNLCHPSLPPWYLQHEEHRPLLPYCLLMGLERPQDVARFTAADVKAAGKCRSWVGVDGAGSCELLYGVLSINGASTSWLPWLAAQLRHERITTLNIAARVLISVQHAHTSFLLRPAEAKAQQSMLRPAQGLLQKALDALPEPAAPVPEPEPALQPPPPAPPAAAPNMLAAALEAASKLNAEHKYRAKQLTGQAAGDVPPPPPPAFGIASMLPQPPPRQGETAMELD